MDMGLPLFPFSDLVAGEHFNRSIMEAGRMPVYTKVDDSTARNEMSGVSVTIEADEQVRSNDGRWLQPGQQNPLGDVRPASRR